MAVPKSQLVIVNSHLLSIQTVVEVQSRVDKPVKHLR